MPDFFNNLGLCLRAQGRLEEAVAEYRKALNLHPAYAPAWSNIGLDLHKLGHLDEALEAFNRGLALDANLTQARFSRALVLLTRGDYARGWAEYESRMGCPEYAASYRLPAMAGTPRPWQGEALAGKSLLLLAEQGIGDTLQFIRYVRPLADQGARVGLYVRQAHVAGLLRNVHGLSEVPSCGPAARTRRQISAFRAALQTTKRSQPFRIAAMAARDPGVGALHPGYDFFAAPERSLAARWTTGRPHGVPIARQAGLLRSASGRCRISVAVQVPIQPSNA